MPGPSKVRAFGVLIVTSSLVLGRPARADGGPPLCTQSTVSSGNCIVPNPNGSPPPPPQAVTNGQTITFSGAPPYPFCPGASIPLGALPCTELASFSVSYTVYDPNSTSPKPLPPGVGFAPIDPGACGQPQATSCTYGLSWSPSAFTGTITLIVNPGFLAVLDSKLTANPPFGCQVGNGLCGIGIGGSSYTLQGTGSPPGVSVIQAGPGKAFIPRAQGNALVDINPPAVTRYGRTWLPFQAMATDGTKPSPGVQVSVSAGAGGAGVTLTAGDPTGSVASLTTGPDGLTSVAYLIVDESAAPITSASVSAQVSGGKSAQTTWNVVDNLQAVVASYQATVPIGAVDPTLKAAFTPPLGLFSYLPLNWYTLNEQNAKGAIVCSHYRSLVLDFLNKLRASPQGWLLNGLDYGPATTQGEGHFFVIVWPHSSSFQGSDALIFDPWPAQTPIAYTKSDYNYFAPRGYKNDPGFVNCPGANPQPPYPNYPNPAPYPASGAGCGQTEGQVNLIVTLHSPVDAVFTAPDGGHAGYLSPDAGVNDFGNGYERLDFPEDDAGTRGKLMGFGATSGTLDVVGLESGTFGMDVGFVQPGGDLQISRFSQVNVAQGETIHFVLDPANACASGTRAAGGLVAASSPCPLPALSTGTGSATSSGCSSSAGTGGSITWFALAFAVLGWRASRRLRRRDAGAEVVVAAVTPVKRR